MLVPWPVFGIVPVPGGQAGRREEAAHGDYDMRRRVMSEILKIERSYLPLPTAAAAAPAGPCNSYPVPMLPGLHRLRPEQVRAVRYAILCGHSVVGELFALVCPSRKIDLLRAKEYNRPRCIASLHHSSLEKV